LLAQAEAMVRATKRNAPRVAWNSGMSASRSENSRILPII
jgi:hypothetical protein